MADIEREASESAIAQCDGDIRKAAALLGISAPTIYRKKAVWDAPDRPPPAHSGAIWRNLAQSGGKNLYSDQFASRNRMHFANDA